MSITDDIIEVTSLDRNGKTTSVLLGPEDVLRAFEEVGRAWHREAVTAEQIVDALMPDDVPAAPVVEQYRRNAELRSRLIAEIPMLDAAAVAEALGSNARNRSQAASNLVRKGRVLVVVHRGRRLFPAFQFETETGRPSEAVVELNNALATRGVIGWSALAWMTRPLGALGGRRPLDVLGSEPGLVLRAAADIGRPAG